MTFLGTRLLGATFFLTAAFFVGLRLNRTLAFLKEALAFEAFRGVVFFATALFAFGRLAFGAGARLFAADFGEERRVAGRDVERLKLLVTALIRRL